MSLKIEKTDNKNEIKLEFTVESEIFEIMVRLIQVQRKWTERNNQKLFGNF